MALTDEEKANVLLVNPRAIAARDLELMRVGHNAFGP